MKNKKRGICEDEIEKTWQTQVHTTDVDCYAVELTDVEPSVVPLKR